VFCHVVQFAVEAGGQPRVKPGFGRAEVDSRDTDLLKTERESPALMCRASSGESGKNLTRCGRQGR
jgi:hypothetical protein